MKKPRLFTPGPTEVPPEILSVLGKPIPHHRKPEFKEVFLKVRGKLKELIKSDVAPLIFSASGTGMMEAAVVNFFSPEDKVLVISAGKFGERWCDITKIYGLDVTCLTYEYGLTFNKEDVERELRRADYRGVFVQHTETSTGTEHDIRFLGEILPPSTLLVVDAVSSFGVYRIFPEELGIDVLLWGSQKGLMLPPGLGFIWFSRKAEKAARDSKLPKFYFDILKEVEPQAKASPRFTPSVSLIMGLDVALDMILTETIEEVENRHRKIAKLIRLSASQAGFKLFSKNPAINLTAIETPEGVSSTEIVRFFDEYGLKIATGQGVIKEKIFRIGHMGYVDLADAHMLSSVIENLANFLNKNHKKDG